tara:strand:- start:98 stop:244 length:147 start_codon:yes stop_codon:yes gene_type:complete
VLARGGGATAAATADHYKALAGFDKDTLNQRESWSVEPHGIPQQPQPE